MCALNLNLCVSLSLCVFARVVVVVGRRERKLESLKEKALN